MLRYIEGIVEKSKRTLSVYHLAISYKNLKNIKERSDYISPENNIAVMNAKFKALSMHP